MLRSFVCSEHCLPVKQVRYAKQSANLKHLMKDVDIEIFRTSMRARHQDANKREVPHKVHISRQPDSRHHHHECNKHGDGSFWRHRPRFGQARRQCAMSCPTTRQRTGSGKEQHHRRYDGESGKHVHGVMVAHGML